MSPVIATPVPTLPGFLVPGGPEFVVILVIGLLLYGRRLPEVGRAVGKTVVQLRRQFDDFKRELTADESLRDARSHLRDFQSTVRDARSSVRNAGRGVDPRRHLPDPARMFDDLTDTSRSTNAGTNGDPAPGTNGEAAPPKD